MLVQDLQAHISEAVEASVGKFFMERDAQFRQSRESDRKSRKKGVKKVGDGWEERYPLVIRHYGTTAGRNATVAIEGCSRSFEIYQNASRPLFNRWDGKKPAQKPEWLVKVTDKNPKGTAVETIWDMRSEDFDSLLQKVIVMMMGHAFMEASV